MIANILNYVLPFAIIITVLVFVHELGHYLYARKFGVKVDTFSIGMGNELFGFNDKEGTRWKFSLIPLGGYVTLHGDKDAASTPNEEELKKMPKEDYKLTLFSKTPLQRVAICAAGPVFNILYGLLVFIFIYALVGKPLNTNEIEKINNGYPLASLDFKNGDKITMINKDKIEKAKDIIPVLSKAKKGDVILVTRVRDNVGKSIEVQLSEKKMLGVSFKVAYEKLPLVTALFESIKDCFYNFFIILVNLAKLFVGSISMSNIGGPLAIANAIGNTASNGDIVYCIFFSALISLNLAVINLLPIPALDGGHILFDLLESAGIKIKLGLREKITGAFFILLIALMLLATYNDILKFEFVQNLFK